MKIITDNAAYVQLNDIAFLNHTDQAIPASIYMKVFGNGMVIIDDSNRYDFVKFDSPNEIEFFKSIDWMIDYNNVKDLSEDEIIELGQSIANENNNIAKIYNAMLDEDKEKHENLVIKCELLQFKMFSLRDILWFKQGHIKMNLPGEFNTTPNTVPEKGIRKLIKNLLNMKKK